MKFIVLLVLAAALLAGGLVETLSLRRHNALRQVQVAELRQRSEVQEHQAAETRARLATAVAPQELPDSSPSAAPTAAAKLRTEIAALERHAEEQRAAQTETTDAPATNRDPQKGMTKLEYFQNAGQGTPAAAFQTLVWAALKGDYPAMAQTIGLEPGAREKILELMADLPPAAREKYPTPESVMALFLAKAMVQVSAIQIVGTEPKDAVNAMISVRGLMGNDQKLPMRLGAAGWQLWEGEQNVEWLRAEFRESGKK